MLVELVTAEQCVCICVCACFLVCIILHTIRLCVVLVSCADHIHCSDRHRLNCDDCVDDKTEDYQNCSMLYCVSVCLY